MKYCNTDHGIISTFVKLSFLSMSVMRQILQGAAAIQSYVRLSVGYVLFAVGWT